MTYKAIAKNRAHMRFLDPVITVRDQGRAHLSMAAQEILGNPDDIVVLSNGPGYAIRVASNGDCDEIQRAVNPNGILKVPRIIPVGYYVLVAKNGIFRLERRDESALHRQEIRLQRAR